MLPILSDHINFSCDIHIIFSFSSSLFNDSLKSNVLEYTKSKENNTEASILKFVETTNYRQSDLLTVLETILAKRISTRYENVSSLNKYNSNKE